MKLKLVWILPLLLGGVAHGGNIDYADWEQTKRYDFDDKSSLDEFTTQYIWNRETIINKESQFYIDPEAHGVSPFTFDNGILSIHAALTPTNLKDKVHGQPYISGVLTTRDKGYSQQYGLFEARMKLPKAQGAWPAFWLYPTFKSWPAGIAMLPELDIMEGVADVKDGVFHASMHSNETGKLVSDGTAIPTNENLTDEFHTYAMVWNETDITWYFNGKEVKRRPTPSDMHEPRHVLLNLAIGGWAGEPNPSDYPAQFDIDYVAFYRSVKEEKGKEEQEDVAAHTVMSEPSVECLPSNGPLRITISGGLELTTDQFIDILKGADDE